MPAHPHPTARQVALLLFGTLMGGTAVLMIKASTLPPAALAAGRLLVAALILLPLRWAEVRAQPPSRRFAQTVRPSLLPGLILGLHFIAWNAGAHATLAGNAALVVNLSPLVMPFFAWFLYRERVSGREAAGTGLALLGLALLAWGDYHFSPEHLLGDGLCFLAMVLFVFYIALARGRARPGALFTYLVPLYAAGGLGCAAWSLVFERGWAVTGADLLLVLGLALLPTIAGHSINNWAMTVMRAQTASLLNLMQFVFAGVLAYLIFAEVPAPYTFLMAALVVAGAVVALLPRTPRRTGPPAA